MGNCRLAVFLVQRNANHFRVKARIMKSAKNLNKPLINLSGRREGSEELVWLLIID